jgi:putative transposase
MGNVMQIGESSETKVLWRGTSAAESFFGTLKTEFVHPRIFTTREIAKTAIAEWIEAFYNRKRLHSTIGYLFPVNFEENYWANQHSPMPHPSSHSL